MRLVHIGNPENELAKEVVRLLIFHFLFIMSETFKNKSFEKQMHSPQWWE